MVVALVLAALALRAGLALRRSRRGASPRPPALRRAHLRLAKPAVALALVGFAGGPLSAAFLRDWPPFGSLHAWLGLVAAGLFAGAGALGLRLEGGRSRSLDLHALLGGLALLAGALAAVAGFVLLP